MTTTTFDDSMKAGDEKDRLPDRVERTGNGEAPAGWAARLVGDDPEASFAELGRRALAGLGLSALYGVALGARQGGRGLLQHAVGVPLGLLLVTALGIPSLFVFLSICRAPIDARTLIGTGARGIGNAGVLLAGLAPAAALFVVSSATPTAARGAVLAGLLLGGGVALGRTVGEVARGAARGRTLSALGGTAIALGFGAFAVALAARVWTSLLPILGGQS